MLCVRKFPLLSCILAAALWCAAPARAQESHNPQPFGMWLQEFRAEAQEKGIPAALLEEALSQIAPLPRVIELDRSQPEGSMTLQEYLHKVLPQKRIDRARALYRENYSLLKQIGAQYGVQPQYIVALWGIESNFGERMGTFNVVEALATLAYDGRRSGYFRKELLNALVILQEGHVTPENMQGSWAGAMGQCQFMPTSFLNYAVDADGDGRKDIWGTRADVFASIAHYLHREGWDPRKGWGKKHHPQDNFKVLMKWNRSTYFGTAVGLLADLIVKPVKNQAKGKR